MLSDFLTEELSDTYSQLSPAAQSHIQKFRTFLQKYYAAKLGSYPSLASRSGSGAFSKSLFKQMRSEFQKLYDFLADSSEGNGPSSMDRGGLDVLRAIRVFDSRYQIEPLPCALPLVPENDARICAKPLSKRSNLTAKIFPKNDKPDHRLTSTAALEKATNCQKQQLTDCTLVRAYRGFEKECSTTTISKAATDDVVSQAEGRRIRWLLIYSSLQILIQATKIPDQVRATQNIAYNICIRTGGCPAWNDRRSCYNLIRTQSAQAKNDYRSSLIRSNPLNAGQTPIDVMTAFNNHVALREQGALPEKKGSATATTLSIKDLIAEADCGGALTIMPELQHPSPQRATHFEILIEGYGRGLDDCPGDDPTTDAIEKEQSLCRNPSSSTTLSKDASSRWSDSTHSPGGSNFASSYADSPRTSGSFISDDRPNSVSSTYSEDESLEQPFGFERIQKPRPISTYSVSIYDEDLTAAESLPDPLFSPSIPSKRHAQPPPMFISRPTQKRVGILSRRLDRHAKVGSIMVMNEELAAYLKG